MSKQEKRIKKELEKFWRKGRFWEWLAMVEKENLHRDFAREVQEAWTSLVKKAVRLPANLQEFWAHLPTVKRYPSSSDFQCLLFLRDFVAGKEVRAELAALRNLTFPAESFRQKALSWKDEAFPEQKIRDLFGFFVTQPGNVTPKHYQILSSFVGGTSLAGDAAALGSKFEGVRRLNRKTRGRKRWGGELLRKAEEADRLLKDLSERLAPPLQEILFYPFLFQAYSFFLQNGEKEPAPVLLRVASSIPFLSLKAAGEKGVEIQKHILGAKSNLSDLDRSCLAGISSAPVEEKAAFLTRMRSALQKGAGEEYHDEFRRLYQSLLTDLAARQDTLPERERRELSRVMNASIIQDLPSFLTEPADGEQLLDILKPLAAIGLGSGKVAVLALILAERTGEPDLKKEAQDFFKRQGDPAEEDVLWVLDGFPELVTPEVSALKPLLEAAGGEAAFAPVLAERIWGEFELFLILHGSSRGAKGPFAFFGDLAADDLKMIHDTWRRELSALQRYPAFVPLRTYLSCFPEGYFTFKGFRRYLDARYKSEKGLTWALAELEKRRRQSLLAGEVMGGPFSFFPVEQTLSEMEEAVFLAVEEGADAWREASLETLEKFTEILLRRKPGGLEGNLLIRISNLLGERLSRGETRVYELRERIIKQLIHHRGKYGRAASR